MAQTHTPNLEELIQTGELQRIICKRFGIVDVDITRKGAKFGWVPDYDDDEFFDRTEDLFDVEEYSIRLKQNNNDIDALNDFIKVAVKYFPGNKSQMGGIMQANPHIAISLADSMYSNGTLAMARYVECNRDDFFDNLDEKQLFSVFERVPSFVTKDKEYDKISKVKKVVSQMKKPEDQRGDVIKILKPLTDDFLKTLSKREKEFVERYKAITQPLIANSMWMLAQTEYHSFFKDKKGNLQKKEIQDYLEANYDAVEDFITDEIPSNKPRERFDFWDKNLKEHYFELARELYGPVKKKVKMDRNEDKEKRKALAKAYGMRT